MPGLEVYVLTYMYAIGTDECESELLGVFATLDDAFETAREYADADLYFTKTYRASEYEYYEAVHEIATLETVYRISKRGVYGC